MSIRRTWIVVSAFIGAAVCCKALAVNVREGLDATEAVTESMAAELRQCVWLRDFPPPLDELPVSLIPRGEDFVVWSPSLGILRNAVDLPFYLSSNCDVRTRVEIDAHGFGMTFQITNNTGLAQSLPTLQIPGNQLLPIIENLDHRVGCAWETIDASDGSQYSSRKAAYPESLYAPVIILRDWHFAVGFALNYDVLGYAHEIRTNVYRGPFGSQYADYWTVRFYLDGMIQPGETRNYRLSVNYNLPKDWIFTLRPYRKFLRSMYGDVQYRQDMRPVWMQQLGDTRRLSPNNMRGFNGARADLNGFARDVDSDLGYMLGAGYERALVRTPAGVYFRNRQNNFPPQITTSWTPPMRETGYEWRRLGQAGIDLYFWWGRSGQFADRWDDDELDDFDPSDSVQSAQMMLEWTNAISVGVKGLGLDKFTVLRPWAAFPWLDRLWAVKPDASFIAEPVAYDLLNIRIPTFLYSEDVRDQPHLLADFLVPGREIWVLLEGEDNTLERALRLIDNGLTIVTNAQDFGANDLMEAVRRAQNCGPGRGD